MPLTRDDFLAAQAAVLARGEPVSGQAVWRELHAHQIPCSRRTVLRYLHELAAATTTKLVVATTESGVMVADSSESEVLSPPAPALPPEMPVERQIAPPDPVELAQEVLERCQRLLDAATADLIAARTQYLAAVSPIRVGQVLHGSLHPDDTTPEEILSEMDDAKRVYDRRWGEREEAQQHLTQMQQQYRRAHQEAYVERHRPDLPHAVTYWHQKLTAATNDHLHAQARKEYAAAMHAWQTAVLAAPWTENGTGQG